MSDSSRLISAMQMATALSITPRAVQRRMRDVASMPLRGRGGPRGWPLEAFPVDWQARYLAAESRSAARETGALGARGETALTQEQSAQLHDRHFAKPATLQKAGQAKLEAVQDVFALIQKNGMGKLAAIDAVAAARKLAAKSLRRWCAKVQGHHRSDWWALLTPDYVGRTAEASFDAAAWSFFKDDYLRSDRPALAASYERMRIEAVARGWTIPSIGTCRRRAKKLCPYTVKLARFGAEAVKRMVPPLVRDKSALRAMEVIVGDGRRADVMVEWPDGTIGRPVIYAWQDVYSGMLLGWRVDKTECTELVRLSFGDVVEAWGVPDSVLLDNGRAGASKWLTGQMPTRYRFKIKAEEPAGIFRMLGIEVRWSQPYSGQSKPIERAFRDLAEYLDKHPALAGAWIGNRPGTRPEDYDGYAAPLETFLQVCERAIHEHNRREGRRSATARGGSFRQAFEDSYKAYPPRKASAKQRALWMLGAEAVTARAPDGAVWLGGNSYWCEQLAKHIGDKLVVRFDPQRLDAPVHVYTMSGDYVAEVPCREAGGFLSIEDAQEQKRLVNRIRRRARENLEDERTLEARKLGQLMLGSAPPPAEKPIETKLTRPVFTDAKTNVARMERAEQLRARQAEDDAAFAAGIEILEERRRRAG